MGNNSIPWPTAMQTIKPAGQEKRQSDKQYKQHKDRDERDDENGFKHIDEYA